MKDHDKGFGKCAFGTAAFGTPGSYTYFRYNKAGWMEKQKNFNRTFAYYVWDKAGRESAIHHEKSDASALVTLDYTRDKNGNITKIDRESGRYMEYTYDKTEQLTSEVIKAPDGTPLYSFDYDYDGAGNRLRMIRDGGNTYYTYNKANELRTEFRGTEHAYFFYDGKGNTVRERQKDGFNRYYWYDADNMMTKVHYGETGERTHLYFKYNAAVDRAERNDWGAAEEEASIYTCDGIGRSLIRTDPSSSRRRYVYSLHGPSLPIPVSFMDTESSPFSLCVDSASNLLATCDPSGHLNFRYFYDTFGICLEIPSSTRQVLLASSIEYDFAVSLYAYVFRSYAPSIARWLQRDPIYLLPLNPSSRGRARIGKDLPRKVGGLLANYVNLNRYLYRANNPSRYDDPFGLYAYDTHYWRTYEAGIAAGLTPAVAARIAAADNKVDIDRPTVGPTGWIESNYPPHFMQYDEARAGVDSAISSCGIPEDFGKALHSLQDWYSHRGKGMSPNLHAWFSLMARIASVVKPEDAPILDPDHWGDDRLDYNMLGATKSAMRALALHYFTHGGGSNLTPQRDYEFRMEDWLRKLCEYGEGEAGPAPKVPKPAEKPLYPPGGAGGGGGRAIPLRDIDR